MDIKRIEKGLWWDRNWELLNGCSKVSPACNNCFAENYIHRFKSRQERWQGLTDKAGHWNGAVKLCPENLDLPLRIKKPTVWFVTERGDLFHEKVPSDLQWQALQVMASCRKHIFMVLTKRPEQIKGLFDVVRFYSKMVTMASFNQIYIFNTYKKGFDNIYWGITAENQEQADKRIPELLQIPGKKFLSIEPMLGPVDLRPFLPIKGQGMKGHLDWVIAGGESGARARPMYKEWVRYIRAQCQAAGVPFFFKQWGNYKGPNDWTIPAGRLLDGRKWNERPF